VTEDFALYVHYPLCRRRCEYCDFPTVVAADFPHDDYATKVTEEIAFRADDYAPSRLRTIYFGGGTPSLWPATAVQRVIDRASSCFSCADALEITLEANPGTLDRASLRALRAAGVNRLSLGLQSLDDAVLAGLTRDHTALEGHRAFDLARDADFANVNCDVICGIAGRSVDAELADLEQVCHKRPEHLSLYSLTLSSGAPLRRRGVRPAADDDAAAALTRARGRLEAHGMRQYEVSNYAQEHRRSKHNQLIWQGQSYMGVGAAAHSMRSGGHNGIRTINPPFSRYMDARPTQGDHVRALAGTRVLVVPKDTFAAELLMLGLRTTEGVARTTFRQRWGIDPATLWDATIVDGGLVTIDSARVSLTRRGIWLADSLTVQAWRRLEQCMTSNAGTRSVDLTRQPGGKTI